MKSLVLVLALAGQLQGQPSAVNAAMFIDATLNNRLTQVSFSTTGIDKYFATKGYRIGQIPGADACTIKFLTVYNGQKYTINMATARGLTVDRNTVTVNAYNSRYAYDVRFRFVSSETAVRVGHAVRFLKEHCGSGN